MSSPPRPAVSEDSGRHTSVGLSPVPKQATCIICTWKYMVCVHLHMYLSTNIRFSGFAFSSAAFFAGLCTYYSNKNKGGQGAHGMNAGSHPAGGRFCVPRNVDIVSTHRRRQRVEVDRVAAPFVFPLANGPQTRESEQAEGRNFHFRISPPACLALGCRGGSLFSRLYTTVNPFRKCRLIAFLSHTPWFVVTYVV